MANGEVPYRHPGYPSLVKLAPKKRGMETEVKPRKMDVHRGCNLPVWRGICSGLPGFGGLLHILVGNYLGGEVGGGGERRFRVNFVVPAG
ncbi:hypothetical protein COCSADRAFT_232158 [Bipolaris sorokiniana ND90Pr]|uniref:Uncharacterized protein n=1 Tax=Cochliobolus sativus (strain ND90Pr / ATCC 201652) TaxID=665912 RepID=M2SXF5_COCSN|nr:uncharacterized protein COCSADRAFT_232158 [Bipolaris sorokiniana ND90Pr]EMD61502.1 hypothetical protein COCSADRAFT_232158 [Bipolaris sorokiniana ND90Pr]